MNYKEFEKVIQKEYGKSWKLRKMYNKKEECEFARFYKPFQDGLIYFQVDVGDIKRPYAIEIKLGIPEDGTYINQKANYNFLKNI